MIMFLVGTTAEMEVPCSPGLRRRRSRVPSEEDDKLINYLVAGGHDGSRERNLSIGGHIGQFHFFPPFFKFPAQKENIPRKFLNMFV